MVQEAQLIFLDTRHSLDPSTPADSQFELNFVQANDVTNYLLTIESVSFPNAVYPINRHSDSIYFKEDGGVTIPCVLTHNNYTGAEFASELQTQLIACSAALGLTRTYTVTYDSQAKKLTIVSDVGPNTIQFVAGDNDVYDEMGFIVPSVDATSQIGTNPVRLDGTQYVDVVSSIGTLNYSSNGRTNILARVPVLSGFGSVVYYENDNDDLLDLVQYDIANVEISLRDDKNNIWDLPSNSNISYVLKLVKLV